MFSSRPPVLSPTPSPESARSSIASFTKPDLDPEIPLSQIRINEPSSNISSPPAYRAFANANHNGKKSSPKACDTHLTGRFSSQTHPTLYRRYLTVRSLCMVLDLIQITLAAVAASGVISPSASDEVPAKRLIRWLDPCLSPAISSFFWCLVDVVGVLNRQRRAHHWGRGIYDLLLSIGFLVGGGFFIGIAWPVWQGIYNMAEMAVAGSLVVCFGSLAILQAVIAYEGVKDIMETRRARKQGAQLGTGFGQAC